MRANSRVVFDAESSDSAIRDPQSAFPNASFAGFLNQTEISKAYVAADVLVLPSDYSETWGLVVNEAMASGLPCIISDRCGCAPDLGGVNGNMTYACGDVEGLARKIISLGEGSTKRDDAKLPSLDNVVVTAKRLYSGVAD
jgi:glycosyltransferase involved in cell wall biosynthesis